MRQTIRETATALTAGATIAVLFDALLQAVSNAIRVTGGVRAPWWARSAENSVWIAFGLVLWLAAPIIGHMLDALVPRAHVSRRTIWNLVGLGLITVPIGHTLGTWIILAMELTVAGSWPSEGRIFMSSAYYGSVLLTIVPWAGAGTILLAYGKHMLEDSRGPG